MSASPTPSPGRSMRVLSLSLVTSPIIVLVAVLFVLPPGEEEPSVAVLALAVGAVVIGFVAAQTLGYRAAPLPPGLDAAEEGRTSVQVFQNLMLLRFVLTEAPVVAALALTFVADQGPWPFVVAVVAGVPSMAFHVLVRDATIQRVRAGLESAGARSSLPEALAA